ISLYLDSADGDAGYSLKFKTYRGVSHASDQTDHPLIRLAPDFETISGLKEIHSLADWKNVAYVFYQGIVTHHLEDGTTDEPEGVQRRLLLTNAEGESVGRKYIGRPMPGLSYGSVMQPGPTEPVAFM